jgi:hypothetical protein
MLTLSLVESADLSLSLVNSSFSSFDLTKALIDPHGLNV